MLSIDHYINYNNIKTKHRWKHCIDIDMSSSNICRCRTWDSPTRRWFYQWKWQCSKSWSHSQNSLCSQISIRRGCACGMLDRGCLLWFTTVYYDVNGKTRRVHSRGRLLLSVDHAHMAWCMDFIRDARAGHAINTCTHAKQKTMYTAVIGKILNFSWEKCVTSR